MQIHCVARRGLLEAVGFWLFDTRCADLPCLPATASEVIRTFTIDDVATHFIPASRDMKRHNELRGLLAELWEGRETVEVALLLQPFVRLRAPWAAGSERFYNLVSESDPTTQGIGGNFAGRSNA
jgi:hypothetical protein